MPDGAITEDVMPEGSPDINICVYCGSNVGTDSAYAKAARRLGEILADQGIGLVYGGGCIGLMGEIARSVLSHGGYVTGIIPDFLTEKEVMLKDVQELIVVPDMHQRKHLMFQKSDAFIALPGGIGTLEELVEQLTWAQLGRHEKPIVLANIAGFWEPLRHLFAHMQQSNFVGTSLDRNLKVIDDVEQILPAVERGLRAERDTHEAIIDIKF